MKKIADKINNYFNKNSKTKTLKKILILIIFLSLIGNLYLTSTGKINSLYPEDISYTDFIEKIENNEIEKVSYHIQKTKITGTTITGQKFVTDNPQTQDFKKYLLENDINVKVSNFDSIIKKGFELSIWLLLIYLFLTYTMSDLMGKQTKSMDLNLELKKDLKLTFTDVAGNDEAKEDMQELVTFLSNPEKFQKYGAKIPKGTLLEGPPGTGKTLLAKALAGTAGVSFISISGSDFVDKFVGVGASRIRQLFAQARENAPCIIFIDEIDAVGRKRDIGIKSNDERDQTLNQLLVEIDGFNGNEGIIVIAATNRSDVLDEALLRSGRFDRHIKVDLPDAEARLEILKVHSKNKPLNEDVDLDVLAKMTVFLSGADLENLMNEAGIYAARESHNGITMEDLEKAYNKIIAGETKRGKITKETKKITAVHEAGHAFVGNYFNRNISKVSIMPTTKGAGGYTLILPDETSYKTKKNMEEEISILLAGRAAEEIWLGKSKITSGASSDLERATKIAVAMVTIYGMDEEIGLLNLQELQRNIKDSSYISSTEIISKLIKKQYKKALKILNKNKNQIDVIISELMEKEIIYEKDLNVLFSKKRIGGLKI